MEARPTGREGPIYALVPARGGSKGLAGKNLRRLGGRSLLAWTLGVARQVPALDAVYVSTDDEAIAREATREGAEVVDRPAALASDESLVIDTIRHHLGAWRAEGRPPEILVLLQPTSPFRTVADVEACLGALADGGRDSAATFRAAVTHPARTWRIAADGLAEPFLAGAAGDGWARRQDLAPCYELNGAVYAFRAERLPAGAPGPLFGRVAAVTMPAVRSLDIDDELDLVAAEALLARGLPGIG